MHEYAICFQIWQTNRQKPNEHRGAFMTVQPQWDHLSIHQLLTNSCCSVALYCRLRFRQSSTWPCRGISRQLRWKVWKVVKFYIWHGNSLLILTKERQNYFPRKTCFIVQMLLFYISKFEAWRLHYEPNTEITGKTKSPAFIGCTQNKFWQSIVVQQCVARKYGSVPGSLGVVSQAGGIYLPTVLHVLCCVPDVSLQFSTNFFPKGYCHVVAISIYFILVR